MPHNYSSTIAGALLISPHQRIDANELGSLMFQGKSIEIRYRKVFEIEKSKRGRILEPVTFNPRASTGSGLDLLATLNPGASTGSGLDLLATLNLGARTGSGLDLLVLVATSVRTPTHRPTKPAAHHCMT